MKHFRNPMGILFFCSFLSTMFLISTVSAQRPSFGPSRGGDRGRDRGSDRSRGLSDFIRRLDTNGNGMIDPSESQGRAGSMLQRIAERDPSINLSRPVPIDRLVQSMERMSGGGRSSSSSSGSRSSSSYGSSSAQQKPEPLVQGFGVESELPPVPGFGEGAEFFSVKITEKDKSDASRSFRYYDRNRDGVLDKAEMSRSRSGDLSAFDRNKDGKLTESEMAYRYARRRADQAQSTPQPTRSSSSSSASRSRSITRSSPSPTNSSSSSSTSSRMADFIRRLDTNGNGMIDPDEAQGRMGSMLQRIAQGDPSINLSRPVPIDKFVQAMEKMRSGRSSGGSPSPDGSSSGRDRSSRRGFSREGGSSFGGFSRGADSRSGRSSRGGFSSRGFGNSSQSGQSSTSSNSKSAVESRKSYRFLSPMERLPEGLPDWFFDKDTNEDGQIMMSEYATLWNDSVASEFNRYDLNQDGVLTPKECLDALNGETPTSSSPTRETSRSPSSRSFSSTLSSTSPASNSPSSSRTVKSAAPTISPADALKASEAGIDARTLKYFTGLLAKSDTNGDGELTEEEWSKMSKNPKEADADKNGRITTLEFAKWKSE